MGTEIEISEVEQRALGVITIVRIGPSQLSGDGIDRIRGPRAIFSLPSNTHTPVHLAWSGISSLSAAESPHQPIIHSP